MDHKRVDRTPPLKRVKGVHQQHDTQAVSMLFQTALNVNSYINKTVILCRSTDGRSRLLCVTLNSNADHKQS